MIYQYNTKNTSFLKMYLLLKEMGIKNNAFFLRLYDESLLDIDPRQDDLPLEIITRIFIECKRNPWYFFREILKVPGASDGEYFELHRANLALFFCLLLNINSIILTPRQCYKTTSIMAFYLWGLKFGFRNTTVGMFTLSENLSSNNIERLKQLNEFLPAYMKFRNKKDVNNAKTVKFVTENNINSLVTKAVGTSEESAANSARGFSFPCLYYDEYAFIDHIIPHYNTAVYSFSTAAQAAESNNEYHHILFSTTAGNLYTESGAWAKERLENAAPFFEGLYDFYYTDVYGINHFDKERIYQYVVNQSQNSRNIYTAFMRIEYEYFELNKPDDYLETQRAYSTSQISFEREVLLKWLSGDGDHPLGAERLEILTNSIVKPCNIIVLDNVYTLNCYRKNIDKNIPYVIGVDCSGNLSKDFSTFVAIDPTNFEVVGTMRINQYSISRFANTVSYIMNNIMPRSIVLIERNGVGLGVVDIIRSQVSSNRIWKDDKDTYGVNATKETREILYNDVLKVSAMNYGEKIHDRTIINEIAELKYNKRGRIDHKIDGHDDTLMAYLWAMWFLLHFKNKSRYMDPIYIGFNLTDEKNPEEIEEFMEDYMEKKDKNILKKYNRWSNTNNNNDFLDGDLTPEELFLKQKKEFLNPKETQIEKFKSKYNDPRLSYADYLVSIKEKEQNERERNYESFDVKEEKEIERYNKLEKEDVEKREKEITEDQREKARERIMKMMNLERKNIFFPFLKK